jgi:hypothetical protein
MKRLKDNKYLLDNRRFEKSMRQKNQWLANLSMKKALQLEESLISSSLIWEWRRNFFDDNPLCLKKSLGKNKKHENFIRRSL